jgi:hypothetical protein
MSNVKSAISNLRVRVLHRKDDISSKLDRHDHNESRGGSEHEVARIIQDEVDDWSSSEDDEQDGLHAHPAKNQDDFLHNDDPQEIRCHYGQLPLMQSQDDAFDPKQKVNWTRLVDIKPEMTGKEISFRARVHVVRHGFHSLSSADHNRSRSPQRARGRGFGEHGNVGSAHQARFSCSCTSKSQAT